MVIFGSEHVVQLIAITPLLRRYQVKVTNSIATKIKSDWSPPNVELVHWDGKLMDTLNTEFAVQERLPILISGRFIVIHFSHDCLF